MSYLKSTPEERKKFLTLPLEERMEITKDVIHETVELAKHPWISFSGGIDSVVMADIIHKLYPKIPAIFNDWGMLLPEQWEFCEKFFKKYNYKYTTSHSGMDYIEFIKKYGFPIFKGVKFLPKEKYEEYNITQKCRLLKHRAWRNFAKDNDVDYYFTGILADERTSRKNFYIRYGFSSVPKKTGIRVKPIILLTKDDIFNYVEEHKLIYPSEYYQDTYHGRTYHFKQCDLDCFMCATHFSGTGFGRVGRIARDKPELMNDMLDRGLRDILVKLCRNYPTKSQYIANFLEEYDPIYEDLQLSKHEKLF